MRGRLTVTQTGADVARGSRVMLGAERLIVSHVEGPGPAGARVDLLIGIESVITPANSWLAAHGAWRDLRSRALAGVGLGPPYPNPDHDDEYGDVKYCPQNDDGGQIAVHFAFPSYLAQPAPAAISSGARARSASQARGPGEGERWGEREGEGVRARVRARQVTLADPPLRRRANGARRVSSGPAACLRNRRRSPRPGTVPPDARRR